MKIISTNFHFAPFMKFVALEKRMPYGMISRHLSAIKE